MNNSLATRDGRNSFLERLMTTQLNAFLESPSRRERFQRAAVAALIKNPALGQNPGALALALQRCAELGLEPDGESQQCHLIPRGGRVDVMVGYRGRLELLARSPRYDIHRVRLVYDGEAFAMHEHNGELTVEHTIDLSKRTGPDAVVGGYMTIRLTDGTVLSHVLSRADMERHRKAAGKNSGAWRDHAVQMFRKSIVNETLSGSTAATLLTEDARGAILESLRREAELTEVRQPSKVLEDITERPAIAETLTEGEAPVEAHTYTDAELFGEGDGESGVDDE